jgi:hypothetical protein
VINTTYTRNSIMSNQQFDMRETLNLLNSVSTGRRILNEGRVGQIADDLESLSDAEFEKEYGKTKTDMRKTFSDKETVKEMDYGGGKNPNAGHGLTHDDDDDGKKEYAAKKITSKKMTKDATDTLNKELSKAHDKKQSVKEDAEHLDPNLSKAYNLGNETYLAYKNDPELAQAAQDKFESMEIVKQNPQYAKMWATGYRDGERFDKQSMREAGDPNRFDPRASRRHPGDVDENFGGGMRDRPGSDDKSFDLAEHRKFFNKRS